MQALLPLTLAHFFSIFYPYRANRMHTDVHCGLEDHPKAENMTLSFFLALFLHIQKSYMNS